MRLQRIIFASDLNANYIQFWPLVARVWQFVTKAIPTLFLVAPEGTLIEKVPGCEIVYIPPVPGLPSCFLAQTIRMLAPTWYPNDVCVISDIDMIMTNTTFFSSKLATRPDNQLVILNRYTPTVGRPSMCYHIAKGQTFAELFKVPPGPKSVESVIPQLQQWYGAKGGQWATDELLMHQHVEQFRRQHPGRVHTIHTPGLWSPAVNCVTHYNGFKLNSDRVRAQSYVELEPPAPYLQNRALIHQTLQAILPSFPKAQLDSIRVIQVGIVRPNRHPSKPTNGMRMALNSRTPRMAPRKLRSRSRSRSNSRVRRTRSTPRR
jgi:hypothetical protein